jgi:methyltransferase (TIGR00027 family)
MAFAAVWVQMRTRWIDEIVAAFLANGGAQVVLLGAGLDARALRLRDGAHPAVFFEVDHPATQAYKRARLRALGADDRATRYLPFDFERDGLPALPARLASLGHDPSRTTLTLWEGVTMYLTAGAVEASMDAVGDLSAPGSSFVVEYHGAGSRERRGRLEQVLGAIGFERTEPFRSAFSPSGVAGLLEAHGFQATGDVDDADLAHRYLDPAQEAVYLGLRGPWRLHVARATRVAEGA